jgi:hypothetical protein
VIPHVDPVTGEATFIFYEPVLDLGRSIVTVTLRGPILDLDYHRWSFMELLLAALMAALVTGFFNVGFFRWKSGREWTYVGTIALIFLVGTPVI